MAELIHESSSRVTARDGVTYRAVVMGEQHPDGTWHAWIEFHGVPNGPLRATGRETSQVSRGALEYWASGLERVYFEGAFDRAGTLIAG
jgi:hypothetical protein